MSDPVKAIPSEALAYIKRSLSMRTKRLLKLVGLSAPEKIIINEIELLRNCALALDLGYTREQEAAGPQSLGEAKNSFGFCSGDDCWVPVFEGAQQCERHQAKKSVTTH